MITLTYARAGEWQPYHVSQLNERLKKWAWRRGFSIPGVWVAEIQPGRYRDTGESVVHYHLIIWVPMGVTVPNPDKQGWWPHGFTRTERARSAVGYLTKYASKGDSGAFPRGLRLSGGFGITQSGRQVRRWLCMPGWLVQRAGGSFQRITRLPGGIFVSEETGECWRSPWVYVGLDGTSIRGKFVRNGGMLFKLREAEIPSAKPPFAHV